MNDFDVVIVGGGLVGSALACALGDSTLRVALIEHAAPAPASLHGDYDLRVSALTLASRALLQSLGAWRHLEELAPARVHRISAMVVWERAATLRFSADDVGQDCVGLIAENRLVLAALRARLMSFTNIASFIPAQLSGVAIDEDAAQVRLADGRTLSARVVIGADGAHSQLRNLAGITQSQIAYGQTAIVATITLAGAHHGVAYQRFLPTGPVALLPLDATRYSIVWSCDDALATALLALTDADFRARLRGALGDDFVAAHFGDIVHTSARASFPLRAANASHYVAARIALIGDAAHTIHPLAGQGLNLGFADAAALAQTLIAAQAAREDLGSLRVLRRYERWRKGHNLALFALTDGLQRLFGNTGAPARFLRDAGLRLVAGTPPIKRRLLRYATGLDGDLPARARVPAIPPNTHE